MECSATIIKYSSVLVWLWLQFSCWLDGSEQWFMLFFWLWIMRSTSIFFSSCFPLLVLIISFQLFTLVVGWLLVKGEDSYMDKVNHLRYVNHLWSSMIEIRVWFSELWPLYICKRNCWCVVWHIHDIIQRACIFPRSRSDLSKMNWPWKYAVPHANLVVGVRIFLVLVIGDPKWWCCKTVNNITNGIPESDIHFRDKQMNN